MVATNVAVTQIKNWLGGSSATAPTHIAYGTDGTFPTKNDVALGSELDRKTFASKIVGTDNVVYTIMIDSIEQVGQNLQEMGLINASSGGDLFQRASHATIYKNNQLEVQYEITIRIVN